MLVQEKLNNLCKDFLQCDDLITKIAEVGGQNVGFAFLKSMTNQELFTDSILKPILKFNKPLSIYLLKSKVLPANELEIVSKDKAQEKILKGCVCIVLQDGGKFVCVDIQKYPTRVPSEPPTSSVIQGPREGFVEDIKTNITLLRRRFYCKEFVIKTLCIGKYSGTQICVCYLNGVADKKIVKLVMQKLKNIKIDGIIDSYYVLEFLQERPNSIFKQVGSVEKPDIVASKILEGRVAIIVDGSPIVLTVPFILLEDLQSSNDYYTNYSYAVLVRIIRILGIFIAIYAPAIFLSFRLYHYNALPLTYEITIADTTQHIPFTPFIEVLFITLLFQILYEVSLRLPQYLGLATSIVGALILGDTGVKAGLISPPAVIIVALAKISLYTVPEEASQINVLSMIFLLIGGSLGMLGVIATTFYFVLYLSNLDTFCTPYLAPFAPKVSADLKDAIFKRPLKDMKTRPKSFPNDKARRIVETKQK